MGLPMDVIEEMYEEGCRLQNKIENERRCKYCRRWFKSKRGKNIHLHYCKTKKLIDITGTIGKKTLSIFFTPTTNIDSKMRNLEVR